MDYDRAGPQADDDGGGGIDEAAEALIGLVGGGPGGPMDEDEQEVGGNSGQKMGPGRVVWAKVEGHDWWPARVVRRRAVPREVSSAAAWGNP